MDAEKVSAEVKEFIMAFVYLYDCFYCARLNLFSPEEHCPECSPCIIFMDKRFYNPGQWFPTNQFSSNENTIHYTLNGDDWLALQK